MPPNDETTEGVADADAGPANAASATIADPLDATVPTVPAVPAVPVAPATLASGSSPSQPRLPVGSLVGRYEIAELIGAGGMGAVYRARDPELGRDVAVKVVPSRGSRGNERLLAEARAMAKLSHPSVIPVFDVGTTDNGVYIVMPLVTGGTLHEWIHAERRPWRHVLEKFTLAGRGLAAAHAAGLIHRDFKPRNVLLDGDDVLVADFGLTAHIQPSASDQPDASSDQPDASALASTIAGTPAYMAPEQAQGGAVDARADQYSFCVSFWEGLHGERPREAATRTRGALPSGGIPEVPRDRRDAPRWLRTVAARGFAPRRSDRWPSIDILLTRLDVRRRRRRRAIAGAVVGVIALSATAGLLLTARGTVTDCPDPMPRLAHAWSPTMAAQVRSTFAATNLPYASELAERLIPRIDAATSAWHAMEIETCRAQRDRRRPAPMLDLQVACLDRWLVELEGTTKLMVGVADSKSLDGAADAARALSPVSACADDALRDIAPRPPDKRADIEALENESARIELAVTSRAEVDLTELSAAHLGHARDVGYAPTLSRALRIRAAVLTNAQEFTRAREALEELAQVAASSGNDLHVATAWTDLVLVLHQLELIDEARRLIPVAEAAIARAGKPLRQRVRLLHNEARLIAGRGEAPRALELLDEAQRLLVEAGGDQPGSDKEELLLSVLGARGGVQGWATDYEASIDTFSRAIVVAEQLYGSHHPRLAPFYLNLAESQRRAGKAADSLATSRALVAVLEPSGETAVLARAKALVGDALYRMDNFAESEKAYAIALDVARRVLDTDEPNLFVIMGNRAAALRELGRRSEALELLNQVIAFHEGRGSTPAALITPLHNRGGIARELKQFDSAIVDFTRALELAGSLTGQKRHESRSLVGLGITLVESGRPAAAIEPLERAIQDQTPGRDENVQLEGRWMLGRARVEARRDVARGLAEVRSAREAVAAAGGTPQDLVEIDAWMAKHGGR